MPQPPNLYLIIFPAALLAYYLICWLLVGRDPKIENVTPQYQPPPGVSPAVARYVLTGGSDGTTLAAVLASLAANQVVSMQPEGKTYRIRLLNQQKPVMPEEAAVIKALFGADLKAQPYFSIPPGKNSTAPVESSTQSESTPFPQSSSTSEAVLDPHAGEQIKTVINAIQTAMSGQLHGIYFRWNSGFMLGGMGATFVWAMATALRLQTPQGAPLFLTFWLFFFTSISGLVISGVWASRPAHPTAGQWIQRILVPIIFFGLPGFMIYTFALPTAHGFVLALLCSVALNSIFFMLMRAPTVEGRRLLQQLAGFREFLVRVEQDRLQRMNRPSEKAEATNRFLPYAIALNVREGWGDALAAAFSNVVVER
ncbi:MAG TPA: hypothetical protein VI685_24185 [Candidatus Angelobacter sp.]